MNLIITGACGHIGSYVAENIYKVKKIKNTILLDNLKSNRFCSIFDLNKKNNLKFYIKDLNDKNSLSTFKNIVLFYPLCFNDKCRKKFWKRKRNVSK